MKTPYLPLLWAFLFHACTLIHDEPGDNAIDPTLVDTYFTFLLPAENLPAEDTATPAADVRYTFEITPRVMKMKGDTTRRAVIITPTPLVHGDTLTLPVKVSPASNNIRVWIDYLPRETTPASYYNTTTLTPVCAATPYTACTDLKRAYTATLDIDLSHLAGQPFPTAVATLPLTIPHGKYRLLAADYALYLQDHPDDAPLSATVTFRTNYPLGYNVSEQRASRTDITPGIQFTTRLIELPDHTALIAHDHVFASPDQPEIAIDLAFHTASGHLIQEVKNIRIPVERGKLTTISDKFLTQTFDDPDQDGGTIVQ